MAVSEAWYWCPRCQRAFADLPLPVPSIGPTCTQCQLDTGLPWEEAHALHEELPEVPEYEGKHYYAKGGAPPG